MSETIIAALITAAATIVAAWIAIRRNQPPSSTSSREEGTADSIDAGRTSEQAAFSSPVSATISAPSAELPAPGSLPRPLPIKRVVAEEELAKAIERVLAAIPPGGQLGGITIGRPGRPRVLIYVGSCPDNTDRLVRDLAKPFGYNVSPVRDLVGFGGCQTATLGDPKGY